jgi:hypothetical protein
VIYLRGYHRPLKSQVEEAQKYGDDEFTTLASKDFTSNLPKIEDREPDQNAILLKLRHVEPHDDPWVSNGEEPTQPDRRAVFWLLKGDLHLQVANSYWHMHAGDFAVFNDALVHSVVATRQWLGSAWQLKKLDHEPIERYLKRLETHIVWKPKAKT